MRRHACLALPCAMLLQACSSATPTAAPPTAQPAAAAASAAPGASTEAVAPRTSGQLSFSISAGPRAGDYAAETTADTVVRLHPMGDSKLLALRVVGDHAADATLSFAVNAPVSEPLLGSHDIGGSLTQVAVLPKGTASGDPRFFTVSAQSGSVNLEQFDPGSGRAVGTFRFQGAGGEWVEGRFRTGD